MDELIIYLSEECLQEIASALKSYKKSTHVLVHLLPPSPSVCVSVPTYLLAKAHFPASPVSMVCST